MSKSAKEIQQEKAEASFKRKEIQAREGAKAMADYQAATIATREKTARLRELRLAKEAVDANIAAKLAETKAAAAAAKPVKVAKPTKPAKVTKPARNPAARAKAAASAKKKR